MPMKRKAQMLLALSMGFFLLAYPLHAFGCTRAFKAFVAIHGADQAHEFLCFSSGFDLLAICSLLLATATALASVYFWIRLELLKDKEVNQFPLQTNKAVLFRTLIATALAIAATAGFLWLYSQDKDLMPEDRNSVWED